MYNDGAKASDIARMIGCRVNQVIRWARLEREGKLELDHEITRKARENLLDRRLEKAKEREQRERARIERMFDKAKEDLGHEDDAVHGQVAARLDALNEERMNQPPPPPRTKRKRKYSRKIDTRTSPPTEEEAAVSRLRKYGGRLLSNGPGEPFRRVYTKKFKESAIEMWLTGHWTKTALAKEMGCGLGVMVEWISSARLGHKILGDDQIESLRSRKAEEKRQWNVLHRGGGTAQEWEELWLSSIPLGSFYEHPNLHDWKFESAEEKDAHLRDYLRQIENIFCPDRSYERSFAWLEITGEMDDLEMNDVFSKLNDGRNVFWNREPVDLDQESVELEDYSFFGVEEEVEEVPEQVSDMMSEFMSRVRMDGDHWTWMGGTAGGTPKFYVGGRQGSNARRWIYNEANNAATLSTTIDTSCGEPLCVNPAHLYEAKRHIVRGQAKLENDWGLSRSQLEEIREVGQPMSNRERMALAEQWNVPFRIFRDVIRGRVNFSS